MLIAALLVALLAVATVTDVLQHKIYNWTTYPGILAALGLNAFGSAALAAGWLESATFQDLGLVGLWSSVVGLLACGAVMLICFLLFHVGGGDVKLIAMMGAFLGPYLGITTMLWTFVFGGCMGLILLIWRVGPLRLVTSAGRHLLWAFRLGGFGPLTDEERAQLQPPLFLAPSAMAALLLVLFTPLGRVM